MKLSHFAVVAALAAASLGKAAAGPVTTRTVSLSQEPLVQRLSKDEFRIAFGIDAGECATVGCHGTIGYQVDWKAEDGTTRSENKRVGYVIPPGAGRSITVDRQYFDTAEGQHLTDIVKVRVDEISSAEGAGPSFQQ